jgi:hypothetical protein
MMLEKRNLNYFTHPSFLRLDADTGVVRSRGGTRMIGISEDFLRGFVVACEHEAGTAAPLILRRCGALFGSRLARRFETEVNQFAGISMRDRPMSEFDALVCDLWHGCGMGHLTLDWSYGASGFLAVKLDHSPMEDIGPKGHTADDLFTGVLEGFFGYFSEPGLLCVQTGDRRLGDKEGTTFILAFSEVIKKAESLRAEKMSHGVIVARLGSD